MSGVDRNRYQLRRTDGRQVEVVTDLNGTPLSLRTATLLAERDRWAGTRSTIEKQPGRASGRVVLR